MSRSRLPLPAFHPADAGAAAETLPEWDLSALYASPDDPAIERDIDAAAKAASDLAGRAKGKLEALLKGPEGAAAFAALIADYEKLQDLLGKVMSYAGLLYSGDTTDPQRMKFYGDVQEKITAISSGLLFFELEINRIDDGLIEAGFADPALAHYRPWLTDIRLDKPYQLEDRVEELFHEKSITAYSAWNRLFDETIAGLRFPVDGEELAIEPTLHLLQEADPAKRKAAAEALGKVFGDNIGIFARITNTLAKDKEISDRWRGFKDIADSRHLANRVEREVVDALVEAVQAAYPRLSHRYYQLKARWMGGETMPYWDRNAPLPGAVTRQVPWVEAKATVLDAYGRFSPRMADIARRFFDEQWIDAPVRPGKSPGAFAHPTVPSAHPYVLLNYLGRTRDVMTLAHELGHGVHQVLAGRQGALMAPTPLTLAETASVFGEMLTFQSLLRSAATPAEKRTLLASKIEDMLNTVVRQIAFYSFERKVHAARREGELTADRINEAWLSVQGESLGPAITFGPGYETFWAYIPHFIHSPFYVYAYAFGDCLVNSLYAVFETAEAGFQDKYFAMLEAGGTKHHKELLQPFGLDASDPAFWQMGLSVIERMIGELEALDAEIARQR
ncbi:oligoendopeptidase F [Pleomorphomonas diazotrophica]|uniref:Oligoendopeptidase F n=1 Tax=Pleomorphomonas diazotrophica TaxID=1166257 RepID=A0A1I4VTC9_9HYPH|nr:M3 family oligoendopeptidase [Pleomorphomonas diazotrophica]PKR89302.1 oligoendopeptidase F [Pleomorphomonas diazotrophica]SFN04524.1 oligoendopeptidase F [Pleomorphomonas diazotrophica]